MVELFEPIGSDWDDEESDWDDEEPDRNEGRNYADEHYCHHERSRYDPRS